MIPEWLNLIEIGLLLLACYGCFRWGVNKGIHDTVVTLLAEDIVKEEDLDRLGEKK